MNTFYNKLLPCTLALTLGAATGMGCMDGKQESDLSDKVNQESSAEVFSFVSPRENEIFNYDTIAPLALFWKPEENEKIMYLRLTREYSGLDNKPTGQVTIDILPNRMHLEECVGGKLITMDGQYTSNQTIFSIGGRQQVVICTQGDYEIRARLKTQKSEYTSKVQYGIRE